MKIIGIIPARFDSTRFPGKPLIEIGGKTMIQRVVEQCQKSKLLDKIVVATDDERIFDHVTGIGYNAVYTSKSHQSGTDRCAEVARQFLDYEIVVNIQGDEPFIHPEQIDDGIRILLENSEFDIATLCHKVEKNEDLFNPNIIKVVKNTAQKALYFSRSPIPFVRGFEQKDWLTKTTFYKHVGLYIFHNIVLSELTNLPMSNLEKTESLEQLRWLEAGFDIGIGETSYESFSIDTPEDLLKIS